jgi:hypothetical protein
MTDSPNRSAIADIRGFLHRGLNPFWVARCGVAALLLLAACLKGHALLSGPVLPGLWMEARWFQTLLVITELFAAVWLLATRDDSVAWRVSVVLFSFLLAAAAGKFLAGDSACGCFGRFKVHPRWIDILDGLCLALLCATRKHVRSSRSFRWSVTEFMIPGALTIAAGIPFVLAVSRTVGTALEAGAIDIDQSVVILDAENWLGKACPLLRHIQTRQELERGDVLLVLVRHDCPECEEKLADYQRLAAAGTRRVVLVEVPPFGGQLFQLVDGRLRQDINWFVRTPAEIMLRDGIVTGTSAEKPGGPHTSAHRFAYRDRPNRTLPIGDRVP